MNFLSVNCASKILNPVGATDVSLGRNVISHLTSWARECSELSKNGLAVNLTFPTN